MLKITQLCIYPVKSLAAVNVDTMSFDRLGAKHDRRYMLINEKGQFVTQRQYSQLCLISVQVTDGGWQLSSPQTDEVGQQSIFLPFDGVLDQQLRVSIWADSVNAYDQGALFKNFFSDFLQENIRLVFMPEHTLRAVDKDYSDGQRHVSFADGFPLLLCHEASLQAVNELLDETIEMSRFRANIVVQSNEPAFAEASWRFIREHSLDNKHLQIVKPCSRCVIPSINPDTAEKQPLVWQALKALCMAEDGQIYFGQNMIHENMKELKVEQILLVQE